MIKARAGSVIPIIHTWKRTMSWLTESTTGIRSRKKRILIQSEREKVMYDFKKTEKKPLCLSQCGFKCATTNHL